MVHVTGFALNNSSFGDSLEKKKNLNAVNEAHLDLEQLNHIKVLGSTSLLRLEDTELIEDEIHIRGEILQDKLVNFPKTYFEALLENIVKVAKKSQIYAEEYLKKICEENLKGSEWRGAEEKSNEHDEQKEEHEQNLTVKSDSFAQKQIPSVDVEDKEKDIVGKQEDRKEFLHETCNLSKHQNEQNLAVKSDSFAQKQIPSVDVEDNEKGVVGKQQGWCLEQCKTFAFQVLEYLNKKLQSSPGNDQLQSTPSNEKGQNILVDMLKFNGDILKPFRSLLEWLYFKGSQNVKTCQNIQHFGYGQYMEEEERLDGNDKVLDTSATKKTTDTKIHSIEWNKTKCGTVIFLILCASVQTSSAAATGLDVKPITKVAVGESIELQCKKVKSGGTRWFGGPYNELLTIGKTVEHQYRNIFSLKDTNETYNLVIENATWEFVNSSYTCHVQFQQNSTKRLSEYGYEVVPKVESLTVMQSKKYECFNETIEFKKVNPLPNCNTSLDKNLQVEVKYLHIHWYRYYYAVTVVLVVKNCDGCSGTMHCHVGNEVLNIPFEQDRKAKTPALGKDEESDSETGLIVGLVVGVLAAVVILVAIIGKLYKRGFCRGKTKGKGGREVETAFEVISLQGDQQGASDE